MQEFLDWLYKTYQLKNPYDAVKKAMELLEVTEVSIYNWKNGRRNLHPSTRKLMMLIVENHELKRKLKEKLNHQ